MMTDPIADLLTRIRNANAVRNASITLPTSRVKVEIAKILKEEGFIVSYEVETEKKELTITLKYVEGVRVINGIKRISKPGLRIHSTVDKLPKVLNGLGISIISTSQGLLTDTKARELHLGGEVVAYVW
ncbi:MAG: 30S ribosomal protein S8 [Bacillales bacterium]|jgi:small subunit ribosomal protein S8|nr:30S ribosomal protein S8 [Bacillales bacterium]